MKYLLTVMILAALLFWAQASISGSPRAGQSNNLQQGSDAMAAYEEARIKIAKAKASGAVVLNLADLYSSELGLYSPKLILTVIPHEISALENLQGLNLFGTTVTDLRPLSKLTQLRELNLFYVPVSNIAPLAELKNLEHLDLSDTQVSDIRPLAKLTRLRYLDLSNTKVSDLSPLEPLVKNGLVVIN